MTTRKIKLKRGLEKDLRALDVAEPGFTTDTKKLFIGSPDGNVELPSKNDVTEIKSKVDAIDTKVTSQASGSPKGTYATTVALQTAFPTGNTNIYLVTANGNWYYWSGTVWTSGGVYQATGIAENSITETLISPTSRIAVKEVGKNLFDKMTITPNMFVRFQDGKEIALLNYNASDYIGVIPNLEYTLSNTLGYALEQLAFYDAGKIFVSGLSNMGTTGSVTITVPSGAEYVRISIKTETLSSTQLEQGTAQTPYESFYSALKVSEIEKGGFTSEYFADGSITYDKIDPNSKLVVKKPGVNLYDVDSVTNGFYVNYSTGILTAHSNMCASSFINVLPNTQYTHSNIGFPVEQLAYYDINKKYISGVANTGVRNSIVLLTPINARHVRITSTLVFSKAVQFQLGTSATPYEKFSHYIKTDEIEKNKFDLTYFNEETLSKLSVGKNAIEVTVKKDGTGNFTDLRQALESITDSSKTNPYVVLIGEGTYDIFASYSDEEINSTSFRGLEKPNYVSLVGTGSKTSTILKGEIADTFPAATMARVATLVTYGTGELENLTVTAKNLRYAVHDDYAYPKLVRRVKNCDFIKYGSKGYQQAYGGGTRAEDDVVFEDCNFIKDTGGIPFSYHNNVNFIKPSRIKLVNCSFEAPATVHAVRFGSMGSGQTDTIEMMGCRLQGGIELFEEQSNGVGIDFKLTGYGNDVVPVTITHTHPTQQPNYDFQGETRKMYNGDPKVVSKGTPVRLNSYGNAIATNSVNHFNIFGILTEDIAVGASGIVRIGGYLNIKDTTLTGLVIGDAVGVTGGVLAKVTTNWIGVVVASNWIKLKF